jgi:hypothetical protein
MPLWARSRHREALIFRREGGMPPPDHEVLTLDAGGSFDLWRTIARASRPPSPVGRFRGQVDGDEWSQLARMIDACRRAPAVELSLPPDAAQDKVVLGKRISTWADDKTPPAPFDTLAAELRRLLGSLTASPEAAIAAEITGQQAAQLVHLGVKPLELDLTQARVRAVRWGDDGAAAEEWTADVGGPRSVAAGPDWSYQLPFEHPFGAGATVSVHVDEVLAFDGEFWRACSLQRGTPSGP